MFLSLSPTLPLSLKINEISKKIFVGQNCTPTIMMVMMTMAMTPMMVILRILSHREMLECVGPRTG